MSAFAPYQRVGATQSAPSDLSLVKRQIPTPGFVRFPYNLTSILFGLPVLHPGAIFGANHRYKRPEEPAEKKEKFFIKNLLKSDRDETEEKQKSEKTRRKFEEEASKMETLVSNLGKSEEGHRCIYCGKVYSRKYGLKIHIRTHTGYKPLKCKYCLRPFGDPSNLNKHVRLHARGQTPYNCQFCGKILVRRRDLERHVKSKHSGEPS
ncbi:hypothetical protein RUM43_011416 [Polyplax serrata]|uniref:C2H2-type domain-containing protein n=1 Tax=Polyplax serrata TaxID=468196 RepID=A0AAN8NY79_POLSC